MANTLVVGGYGFIGSYVTRACLRRGDDVTVLTLQRSEASLALPSKIRQLIRVDLRDAQATQNAISHERFHNVYNLSGYIDHTPYFRGGRAILDQHFLGLQNLLTALDRSELNSFVQIGSSDEYGRARAPQSEEIREEPIAPYSLGKVAAAHLIQMLCRTESFPGVVLRLFLVYGPGQDNRRFIPQLIQGCLSGKTFPVSKGEQLRDFTFVEDIARGILLAGEMKNAQGRIINLASGQSVTIRSAIEAVVRLCGQGQPTFGAVAYRPGENMSLVADISLAKQLLAWRPEISLEDGLQRTVADYRSQTASPKLASSK